MLFPLALGQQFVDVDSQHRFIVGVGEYFMRISRHITDVPEIVVIDSTLQNTSTLTVHTCIEIVVLQLFELQSSVDQLQSVEDGFDFETQVQHILVEENH